jgi:hypothetical protein
MTPDAPEIDHTRRLSFDARAERYDAARPSYPDAPADDVLSLAGRRVLEIGAGTGKATVVFARKGASIVALEPAGSLAAVLRRNVAGHDVTVEQTTFEAWPIARSFDVVMAAQSLHWVDPRVTLRKASRRTRAERHARCDSKREASVRGCLAGRARRGLPTLATGRSPDPTEGCRRNGEAGADRPDRGERPVRSRGRQGLSVDHNVHNRAVSGLLDTYSDQAVLSQEHRAPLYQSIADVLERRGGLVELRYVSMAFMARRA